MAQRCGYCGKTEKQHGGRACMDPLLQAVIERSKVSVDRNTRIAQALEPEPRLHWDINGTLGLWDSQLGMWVLEGMNNWKPKSFDTDENAFRLAWSRLTEEQKSELVDPVCDLPDHQDCIVEWMKIPLTERCDWLLAVLEKT